MKWLIVGLAVLTSGCGLDELPQPDGGVDGGKIELPSVDIPSIQLPPMP